MHTIPTTYSPPKVMERETQVTKDTMPPTNNGSTKDVQPVVIQIETLMPNSEPVVAPVLELVATPVSAPKPNQKPSIPYPSQKLRDKTNDQKEKIFKIFKDLDFNISFADALILMPKFGPTIKSLFTNKEKQFELAKTPLNEHCSAVLLKKLSEKLGDPDKFLIPCDFSGMDECLALADLSASINLMPLSVWNKLSLHELSPTCMTLELADRSISRPVGVTEDVFVKVLKSHKQALAWQLFDIKGINLEVCTHKILMEDDFKPAVQHQRRVNPKIQEVIKKEVLKFLDAGLIYLISDFPWVSPVHYVPKSGFTIVENEENELIPTRLVTGWPVCIDCRKLNDATRKDHFPLPFMDQMLERLAGNKYYYFLDEGIVLGHKISKNGIEVDKAKVDVIAKLPHPTTDKGIRSFIGHAGFYQRFIQEFSKIARPMTRLLEKDTPFFFSKECVEAFQTLKKKLTEAPILVAPDWDLPFELMCDASDFSIGAVLGQRKTKHFQPIL
nr:hypothetical protein [Tanacetum cinerariifolium]